MIRIQVEIQKNLILENVEMYDWKFKERMKEELHLILSKELKKEDLKKIMKEISSYLYDTDFDNSSDFLDDFVMFLEDEMRVIGLGEESFEKSFEVLKKAMEKIDS